MNLPTSVTALLPEYILTLTGVLIMLIEAVLKPGASRKPLGWLAIAGTTSTGLISFYQLRLGALTAFSGSIQVDAFSIFFHLLIGAVVVATLLGSLDYFEGHAARRRILCAGALRRRRHDADDLLGGAADGLHRAGDLLDLDLHPGRLPQGRRHSASESSIKYFLLGSFATAFFLYGIALAFGATGSTAIAAIAAGLATARRRAWPSWRWP